MTLKRWPVFDINTAQAASPIMVVSGISRTHLWKAFSAMSKIAYSSSLRRDAVNANADKAVEQWLMV